MADNTTTATPATVSVEEYNKVVERARTFEAKLSDYEHKIKAFDGIDPVAFKAMKEDYDNLRKESAAGDKDKINALMAEKEKEYATRYGTKYTELEGITKAQAAELKKLKVTNVAMQKAANIFTADSLALIEHKIDQSCDWDKDGIIVKGADGKPVVSAKDPRQNMSVDEFLESLAAAHPSIAKSNATGGAATNGTTRAATGAGAKGISLSAYENMSQAERAKLPPAERISLMQQALRK